MHYYWIQNTNQYSVSIVSYFLFFFFFWLISRDFTFKIVQILCSYTSQKQQSNNKIYMHSFYIICIYKHTHIYRYYILRFEIHGFAVKTKTQHKKICYNILQIFCSVLTVSSHVSHQKSGKKTLIEYEFSHFMSILYCIVGLGFMLLLIGRYKNTDSIETCFRFKAAYDFLCVKW